MHGPSRRRVAASLVAGLAMAALSAQVALANVPDSNVVVHNPDGSAASGAVCEFFLTFEPTAGGEEGSWELYDAAGSLVDKGPYAVTAQDGDRVPDSGVFDLANGQYQLWWDDEAPVDSSRQERSITVACEAAASATPPSPSPSAASPSPSPAPASASPSPAAASPSGGVLPTQAAPSGGRPTAAAITPPATDTAIGSMTPGDASSYLVALGALAVVAGCSLALATQARRRRPASDR